MVNKKELMKRTESLMNENSRCYKIQDGIIEDHVTEVEKLTDDYAVVSDNNDVLVESIGEKDEMIKVYKSEIESMKELLNQKTLCVMTVRLPPNSNAEASDKILAEVGDKMKTSMEKLGLDIEIIAITDTISNVQTITVPVKKEE